MADDKKEKPVNAVYLRSYPKVIFFWPLLLVSFILWILEFVNNAPEPNALYGNIWLVMFFVNIFIIAFDFSSAKFFVLIMVIVVVLLLLFFLVVPNMGGLPSITTFNLAITWQFYLTITLILVVVLGLVVLGSRFDYWKIERNEIYHKAGIFSSAERVPTKSLRLKKEIPDVFEFFVLRAGSITLMPGHGDVIPLNTVLNINKKQRQIDWLLSHISMEPDELDG